MRSIGTSVSSAVMAAILTSSTTSLGGYEIPDESAFRICFVVGAAAAFAGGSSWPPWCPPAERTGDQSQIRSHVRDKTSRVPGTSPFPGR